VHVEETRQQRDIADVDDASICGDDLIRASSTGSVRTNGKSL